MDEPKPLVEDDGNCLCVASGDFKGMRFVCYGSGVAKSTKDGVEASSTQAALTASGESVYRYRGYVEP